MGLKYATHLSTITTVVGGYGKAFKLSSCFLSTFSNAAAASFKIG